MMNRKQPRLGLACVARRGSEAELLRAEGAWLCFRGGTGCRKRDRGLEDELTAVRLRKLLWGLSPLAPNAVLGWRAQLYLQPQTPPWILLWNSFGT